MIISNRSVPIMESTNEIAIEIQMGVASALGKILHIDSVAAFHTPGGGRGINIQATRCVLGDNSQVKDITLFLTPPFRKTLNEAKGVDPMSY